jgi:tryptophan-rich sensory protein
MTAARGRRRRAVLVAFAAAFAVATLGGLVTDTGPWYQALRQPAWKPPDALFAPAWTVIFALAALAGAIGWWTSPARPRREWLLALFALNAFLNVLWSILFFGLRRPDWALLQVGALWLSILALIVVLQHSSRAAAALLAPYLLWVTFAALLNREVVRLNAPFGL